MSPMLRATSTSCLFFIVAISDTLFLMISIFDFVEVGIVQGPIFLSVYDSVCRFRWFSKGFIRFCSAWILVLIATDRWIRTRFPFKVNQWCTRRNALITILITIVLGIGLHGHMLSIQLFGGYFPGIPSVACGPIDPTSFYLRFFFTQWPIIQVTFISIIPVLLILASSINIYLIIHKEKKRIQPSITDNHAHRRQARLQRNMLLLMISSAVLFLSTTLPISVSQIVNAYRLAANVGVDINEVINEEAIVNLVLAFNYAVRNSCVAAVLHASNMCWTGVFRLQNDLQATQYQDRFCIFRGYLVYAFCAVVICSFLLQAFYRYILVVYPARSNWLSARNQCIFIVLTWIYALVFPLAFMFTGDIIYNADNDVCDIPIRLSFALIFLALCVYSIPLSLVMFIYLKLIRYVKQMHKRVTPANILFRVQRELKMTRRVVIMLTSLVPICIPYAIFFVLSFFTSLPIYHFRILFTFTSVSFLCTMVIVFKFTDALKLSVMKKLNLRSNTIVPTVGIVNQ
ncbi:unnamed protein product [Adineta steineri]|uniref:G-protein coupled receptors family 1 profile domain-containing protein n=1 Tax=Adineta steineri TaxID=433720 RepID=A0A819EG67_9BILA|nr:unnamed protein product [Adineta steineri]CAF3850301.1 unnamed protein product [Adineta steineri]